MLAENGFAREGYTFEGWDAGAAGSELSWTPASNAEPVCTVMAQWKAVPASDPEPGGDEPGDDPAKPAGDDQPGADPVQPADDPSKPSGNGSIDGGSDATKQPVDRPAAKKGISPLTGDSLPVALFGAAALVAFAFAATAAARQRVPKRGKHARR